MLLSISCRCYIVDQPATPTHPPCTSLGHPHNRAPELVNAPVPSLPTLLALTQRSICPSIRDRATTPCIFAPLSFHPTASLCRERHNARYLTRIIPIPHKEQSVSYYKCDDGHQLDHDLTRIHVSRTGSHFPRTTLTDNIMPLFSSSKRDKKAANEFKAVSYGSTSKHYEFDSSSSSSSRPKTNEKQDKAGNKERGKLTPYGLWVAEQRRRMER